MPVVQRQAVPRWSAVMVDRANLFSGTSFSLARERPDFPAVFKLNHREDAMLYALFDYDRRIGESASTELGAWQKALRAGLIWDIPVADEQDGQVLPPGLHVKRVDENCQPRLE